jgi:PucR C-terminal helix-turn-helix domain/GGDEF-like domain
MRLKRLISTANAEIGAVGRSGVRCWPAMGRTDDGDGARATESLALRVLSRVPALTDALVREIHEQNPGYRTVDVVPRDDLWRSCHDNITRVLELIARPPGRDPTDADTRYDAARATGRRRAEQWMPLDDVLRSFRLGGRLIWEALIEQARVDDSVDTDGLLAAAGRVWEAVDTTSAQVAVAYHAAERELVRADEQRRATLWEGLLHGRAQDPVFAYEVGRIIDAPVKGPCAVVVLDDDGRLADTASGLRSRLDAEGIGSSWQVRTDSLVGLLSLRQRQCYGELAPALAVLRAGVDTACGVSLVVCGLAEVDVAYQQALLARRTLPPGRVEVAALPERLPDALLLSSPALAEQLMRRWLGGLMAVSGPERRLLLGTLQIWVTTGGSIRRTAEAARCHRNTVLNRLQRVQAITGHDFAGPDHQVELALALRASALLPELAPEE